jgi:hypothetical protein
MSTERVQEAAIRFRRRVFAVQSHKVCVWVAARALDRSPATVWAGLKPKGFGFLTNRGRFITRAEAWRVALAAGQIGPNVRRGGVQELHSEDLIARRPRRVSR